MLGTPGTARYAWGQIGPKSAAEIGCADDWVAGNRGGCQRRFPIGASAYLMLVKETFPYTLAIPVEDETDDSQS